MLTDGKFTVHRYVIPFKKYGDTIKLVPFGDVHRYAPLHAEKIWHKFIDRYKDDKTAYFIGMGDYLDELSTSERKMYVNSDYHDSTTQVHSKFYVERALNLAREIRFMKGRCIGLHEGNHFFKLSDGSTTTNTICRELDAVHLGVKSFIEILLEKDKHHTHRLVVCCHHGESGGRTASSSVSKLEKMAHTHDADIICVSDDTEILTLSGWKHFSNIRCGEPIYSLNSGIIEHDIAENVICNQHDGGMVRIKNKNVDFLVTPEHRVLYYSVKNFLYKRADEFSRMVGNVKIPLSGIISQTSELKCEWFRLFGWLLSEGCFRGGSGISISQSGKNMEKCKDISNTLDALGIKYSLYNKQDGMVNFYVTKKESGKILEYMPDKSIPKELYVASREQFLEFLDSLILGDGNWIKRKRSGTFYSIDKMLMDELQHLCAIFGYRTGLRFKKGGFKNGCYVLNMTNRTTTHICHIKNVCSFENYSGRVWCVTTRNTNFIARRNGKVFITGNCMGHDHRKNHVEMTEIGITHAQNGKPNVLERVKYCARTGGFLKGYVDKQLSYIVDKNLPPNSLGNVEFHISPKIKHWRIPRMGKKFRDMEKRWVNVEFHSCNYTEH